MTKPLDPADVNRGNIWSYRQNKPSHVVRDLEAWGVPADASYRILLARGVFKWLGVRRDIIKLKNRWRTQVTLFQTVLSYKHGTEGYVSSPVERAQLRGYLKALEDCRADVRALCHSGRWQSPDNDQTAQRWLSKLDDEPRAHTQQADEP